MKLRQNLWRMCLLALACCGSFAVQAQPSDTTKVDLPADDCAREAGVAQLWTDDPDYIWNIRNTVAVRIVGSDAIGQNTFRAGINEKNTDPNANFVQALSPSKAHAAIGLGVPETALDEYPAIEENVLTRHTFQGGILKGECKVYQLSVELRNELKARVQQSCGMLADAARTADLTQGVTRPTTYYTQVRYATCPRVLLDPVLERLQYLIAEDSNALELQFAQANTPGEDYYEADKQIKELNKEWQNALDKNEPQAVLESLETEITQWETTKRNATQGLEQRLGLMRGYYQFLLSFRNQAFELQLQPERSSQFDVCMLSVGGECRWTLWGDPNSDNNLFTRIIRIAISIMGALAVVVVMLAGYRYLFSWDDEGAMAGAKSMLVNVALGLLLALLSYIIVQTVISFFFGLGG